MSYYGYQYKQQCYIPGGTKCPPPTFARQCHPPGVLKCAQCPPRAPTGAKVCGAGKSLQSPGCSSGCVETRVVEGHHSSSSSCCCCCCSPRSPNPCPTAFPQPQGQGRERLCVSQCGQAGVRRCPQVVCAPAPLYPHSSYPYSYQWSNSYQYNCGQQ